MDNDCKYIFIGGFGVSGSGAFLDPLCEFDRYRLLVDRDFEIRIMSDPDGLIMLEWVYYWRKINYHLNRILLQALLGKWYRHFYEHIYLPCRGEKFIDNTRKYLTELFAGGVDSEANQYFVDLG